MVLPLTRFYILLPSLHPPPMPPRTPLGIINGNRGYGHELTPNQRGKIEGAKLSGSTNKVAASCLIIVYFLKAMYSEI